MCIYSFLLGFALGNEKRREEVNEIVKRVLLVLTVALVMAAGEGIGMSYLGLRLSNLFR